jgi:hypothetical protein
LSADFFGAIFFTGAFCEDAGAFTAAFVGELFSAVDLAVALVLAVEAAVFFTAVFFTPDTPEPGVVFAAGRPAALVVVFFADALAGAFLAAVLVAAAFDVVVFVAAAFAVVALAGAFLAAVFVAVVFVAVVFFAAALAGAFLAAVFVAVVVLPAVLVVAVFVAGFLAAVPVLAAGDFLAVVLVAGAFLAVVFVAGAFLAVVFFAAVFFALVAVVLAPELLLAGAAFVAVLPLVDFRVTLDVTLLAAAAVLPASFFAVDRAMAAGPPIQPVVWRSPHACGEDMPSLAPLQTNARTKPMCLRHMSSGRLERTARRGWDE